MQWGRFTSVSKTNTTISFPTAFSSTNYGIVLYETSAGAQDEWANACWVVSKANGSFVYRTALSEKPAYDWVAIGY